MKILALDTAASWCAAAVYDTARNVVIADVSENIGKGHAEVLMEYVERAMNEAKLSLRDMDRVAVNIGPGSFTGVRIGVSAARGFALALGVPVIGITAFEALAAETSIALPERPVLVLLDAHRGEIYAQGFDAQGLPQSKPAVLSRKKRRRWSRLWPRALFLRVPLPVLSMKLLAESSLWAHRSRQQKPEPMRVWRE